MKRGSGKMVYDNAVLKLLEYRISKPRLEIMWNDGKTSICEIDTFYDSDNGLELDDDSYEEYHVALVRNVFDCQYIEIGTGENKPILIRIEETGKVIFKSD